MRNGHTQTDRQTERVSSESGATQRPSVTNTNGNTSRLADCSSLTTQSISFFPIGRTQTLPEIHNRRVTADPRLKRKKSPVFLVVIFPFRFGRCSFLTLTTTGFWFGAL